MGARILLRKSGAANEDPAPYRVRLATSREDVRAAQTLRFIVFNLEMQEGLESSYLTLRDEDRFDAACDHLLVEFEGEVVGTYRMQTGRQATAAHGFYSAQEFDFRPFQGFQQALMELGRACVRKDHRNLRVLSLLWRGIAQHARRGGCRYLLGCSSLTSQSPAEGRAVYGMLAEKHLAPEFLRTAPLAGWECSWDGPQAQGAAVPRLLQAYLSLGAKICGEPALDRDFKTIDFLTVLDLADLPEAAAVFLGR
jgi:putative hemolysin